MTQWHVIQGTIQTMVTKRAYLARKAITVMVLLVLMKWSILLSVLQESTVLKALLKCLTRPLTIVRMVITVPLKHHYQ
jgi:spore maturation protein SpmA